MSPLSPYLDEELLSNHALSVDGTKIERETGFTYNVPKLTKEKLVEIIDGYKALNVWPADDWYTCLYDSSATRAAKPRI